MNWFEDWFNTSYYHILYKNRNYKEAKKFIDNLVLHLKIQKNQKLIDIACGKGRHANYFNKLGFDVIGIDLSEKNIHMAKNNETKKLKFQIYDMRNVFKENYFDIATNLFTSFGYFDAKKDDEKAMISMAKNLKKNGLLIIDFMNVEKTISNLIPSEIKKIDNVLFKINRHITSKHIVKYINVLDNNKQKQYKEKVKILKLVDFYNLTKKAGCRIINIFGNYNLDPFNAKKSNRLILICKKYC